MNCNKVTTVVYAGFVTFHMNKEFILICPSHASRYASHICPLYTCTVCTVSSILTFLAHVSSITGQAKAKEWINLVNASASIFTWLWLAVIYVCEGGKKNSKSRPAEDLIRVQIKRMHSAEEMLVKGEKLWPSAAIQTLTWNELVVSPGLEREICPCWWTQCYNLSRMWGEYA